MLSHAIDNPRANKDPPPPTKVTTQCSFSNLPHFYSTPSTSAPFIEYTKNAAECIIQNIILHSQALPPKFHLQSNHNLTHPSHSQPHATTLSTYNPL